MPGMDGIAVLRVVRAYLRWSFVPIAILTAYPEDPRLCHVGEHGVKRTSAKSRMSLDEVLAWLNEQAERAVKPPGSGSPPAPLTEA
jgi:CheY-like chemotaxis protein